MLCPECNGDTLSANRGIIRRRTCRECGHQFQTIEVVYDPVMHTKEKLERFMRERKKPSTTAVLAAYFMVASTTINQLMKDLESEGKVTRSKGSHGKNIWSWNYRMAVPQPSAPVRHHREPAPVVGRPVPPTPSYAHVRGYDD